MTTPTPDRVTQHLDCVPERFQVMPEYQGIVQLARELQSDLAAATAELASVKGHADRLHHELSWLVAYIQQADYEPANDALDAYSATKDEQ